MKPHLALILILLAMTIPASALGQRGQPDGFVFGVSLGGIHITTDEGPVEDSVLSTGGMGLRAYFAGSKNGRDLLGVEVGIRYVDDVTGNTHLQSLTGKYYRRGARGEFFYLTFGVLAASRRTGSATGWTSSVGLGFQIVDYVTPHIEIVRCNVDGLGRTGIGFWLSVLMY